MKACNFCGKELPLGRHKYCSTECQIIANKKKLKHPNHLCAICKEVEIGAARKYCKECSKLNKNALAYIAGKFGNVKDHHQEVQDRIKYLRERKRVKLEKGELPKKRSTISEKYLVRGAISIRNWEV